MSGRGTGKEVRLVSLECWWVQPQWRLGFGQINGILLSTASLDAFFTVVTSGGIETAYCQTRGPGVPVPQGQPIVNNALRKDISVLFQMTGQSNPNYYITAVKL